MYRDPRSDMPVTQYSLKWVEPAGLVKFDFLGLKTLTTIDKAVKMINRNGTPFALSDMPIDDKQTFDDLTAGDVVGVFQVESGGMKRARSTCAPTAPRTSSPSSRSIVPARWPTSHHCARKRRRAIEYSHLLKPILEPTTVITYQESEQIGKTWPLHPRQPISAPRHGQEDQGRDGCAARASAPPGRIAKALNTIFDACAKFANTASTSPTRRRLHHHQTAYLRTFPREFFAASMTLDMGNTDKLAEFRNDAVKHGIEIVPPCVNRSEAEFTARDGRIYYAIGAVKGVGQAVAEHIVAARGDRPFADLADFATRVDPRIVTGGRWRRWLMPAPSTSWCRGAAGLCGDRRRRRGGARTSANAEDGIMDMFASDTPEPIVLTQNFEPWSLGERLDREAAAIGFHLSGHPLDHYADLFEKLKVKRWIDFEREVKEEGIGAGKLAGTVSTRNDRRTRKGTPMAITTLSDTTGSYEVVAFSEQIAQYGDVLKVGASVILSVEADDRPDGIGLRLISAQPIEQAAEKVGKRLTVFAGHEKCLPTIRSQLKSGGDGQVIFIVSRDSGAKEYEIELPGGFRISPELAGGIKSLEGVVDVRLS